MVQANTSVARSVRHAGMTLVEMLVAMTCTILLMLAITQTFQSIGEVSSRGRAAIEMSTQLRGVWLRLQEDLQAITVPVRPWPDADGAAGYFEYYDGTVTRDGTYLNNAENNLMGDVDDILAMTCRTTGSPFVGRYHYRDPITNMPTTRIVESNVAEVIWFTQFSDKNSNNIPEAGEMTLHRRVLLVRPDLNGPDGRLTHADGEYANFIQLNDISIRRTGGNLAANSLADLTQRENRYAHTLGNFVAANNGNPAYFQGFPYPMTTVASGLLDSSFALNQGIDLESTTVRREGEDVILSNLMAFDVRVFDKNATVQLKNGEPVSPGDFGYAAGNAAIGAGAFVDLNYNMGTSDFSGLPSAKSALGVPVYDTWSYKYEHDGVDQFNDNNIDRATDGLDNGGVAGAVDDVGERETSPPYPIPLRGIQVRLRVIERDTRQVRQSTLVQDFVPE